MSKDWSQLPNHIRQPPPYPLRHEIYTCECLFTRVLYLIIRPAPEDNFWTSTSQQQTLNSGNMRPGMAEPGNPFSDPWALMRRICCTSKPLWKQICTDAQQQRIWGIHTISSDDPKACAKTLKYLFFFSVTGRPTKIYWRGRLNSLSEQLPAQNENIHHRACLGRWLHPVCPAANPWERGEIMCVHKSGRGSTGSHYLRGGTTVSSSYTHTFRLPIPWGSHQYRPGRQIHTHSELVSTQAQRFSVKAWQTHTSAKL